MTRHVLTDEQRRKLLGSSRPTLAYSISAYEHVRMVADGAAVNRLRRARGWSQMALALRARVNQATIALVETGKVKQPSPDKLARIARALGVGVAALVRIETMEGEP